MPLSPLEKCILNSLAYFHIFNFPLTSWEVYKYLWQPTESYNFIQIIEALENLYTNKILGYNEGFYFFKSKENLIQLRKEKYIWAQNKFKKSLWLINLLSKTIFIKAIFVCNNLAYQNANTESDIDLAIVCIKNRIWTVRFLTTLYMKILRKRPTPKTHKDRICLSFYLSEDNLNLQDYAYVNDIHFIYWQSQFLPIYQEKDYASKFFNSNSWAKKFIPNIIASQPNSRWQINKKNSLKKYREKILSNNFGNWLEFILKKFQFKILPKHLLKQKDESNTNVMINDRILKFHDKDNRLEILNKWQRLCEKTKDLDVI